MIHTPTLERIDTPAGRKYKTPAGNLYPSVTSIFSILENEHLDDWRKRVGEAETARIAAVAARRGAWIHRQCELFLTGSDKLQENTITGGVAHLLYADQWNRFKPIVEQIGEVHALERPLFSDKLKIAGTVDCIGIWGNKLSVIDFKTSSRRKLASDIDTYWMQCAAYAYMWWELTSMPIRQLVILMSVEDDKPLIYTNDIKNWIHKFIELRKRFESIKGF